MDNNNKNVFDLNSTIDSYSPERIVAMDINITEFFKLNIPHVFIKRVVPDIPSQSYEYYEITRGVLTDNDKRIIRRIYPGTVIDGNGSKLKFLRILPSAAHSSNDNERLSSPSAKIIKDAVIVITAIGIAYISYFYTFQ